MEREVEDDERERERETRNFYSTSSNYYFTSFSRSVVLTKVPYFQCFTHWTRHPLSLHVSRHDSPVNEKGNCLPEEYVYPLLRLTSQGNRGGQRSQHQDERQGRGWRSNVFITKKNVQQRIRRSKADHLRSVLYYLNTDIKQYKGRCRMKGNVTKNNRVSFIIIQVNR